MSQKTSSVLFAILVGFLLLAPNAKAEIENQDYGSEDPCFSANYAWGDCFTDASFTGPTATACVAKQSLKQACRGCVDARYDNGQPKGYQICAYLTISASCSCNNAGTPNCSTVGSCTYQYN
jgi:hypothetical protein